MIVIQPTAHISKDVAHFSGFEELEIDTCAES
jgi:hypothetical protein